MSTLVPTTILCEMALHDLDACISFLLYLQSALKLFVALFLFRYIRLLDSIAGYCVYISKRSQFSPTFYPSDVTMIVPTVDPLLQRRAHLHIPSHLEAGEVCTNHLLNVSTCRLGFMFRTCQIRPLFES